MKDQEISLNNKKENFAIKITNKLTKNIFVKKNNPKLRKANNFSGKIILMFKLILFLQMIFNIKPEAVNITLVISGKNTQQFLEIIL